MRIKMKQFSLKKLCYVAFTVFACSYIISSYFFADDNLYMNDFVYTFKKYLTEDISCYFEKDVEDWELKNDEFLFTRDNIFFLSTSCKTIIKASQLCAIEAAVRKNPQKTINILFTRPLHFSSSQKQILIELVELNNVDIFRINIGTYLKHTPFVNVLENFKTSSLSKGFKKYKRVEEILKLASLYKYGGTVVNLDLIMTESLQTEDGFVIRPTVKEQILSADVISLDKISGNKFLEETIRLVIDELKNNKNYTIDVASALTTAFKKICTTFSTPSPENCWGIKVYEFATFSLNFTDPKIKLPNVDAFLVEDTYYRRHFIKDTLLEEVAKRYCPIVYLHQSQLWY